MIHGKQYFVLFLDDFTNALNMQLLATHDQAFTAWWIVQARWENKYRKRVRALQTDNGGEYISAEFEESLCELGIEHRKSISYAHQQNGKAERAVRTIEGRALATLSQAHLSAGYFGEAVLLVGYLWNLSATRVLPSGKTPFELLHGYKPDVTHLRVFGSRCFARIPPETHIKNGPHSREALFLGYPDGMKGWRLRDVKTGSIFNSRDVVFDEGSVTTPCDFSEHLRAPVSVSGQGVASLKPGSPSITPLVHVDLPVPASGGDVAAVPPCQSSRIRQAELQAPPTGTEGVTSSAPIDTLSDLSDLTDLSDMSDSEGISEQQANFIITEQAHLSIRSDVHCNPADPGYDMKLPPAMHAEVMKRSDREDWLAAMKTELALMKEMKVWELVEAPPGRKLVGNRWVFEFKSNDLKGGARCKARLIAQGFSQIPGVDFHQTYAPVA